MICVCAVVGSGFRRALSVVAVVELPSSVAVVGIGVGLAALETAIRGRMFLFLLCLLWRKHWVDLLMLLSELPSF